MLATDIKSGAAYQFDRQPPLDLFSGMDLENQTAPLHQQRQHHPPYPAVAGTTLLSEEATNAMCSESADCFPTGSSGTDARFRSVASIEHVKSYRRLMAPASVGDEGHSGSRQNEFTHCVGTTELSAAVAVTRSALSIASAVGAKVANYVAETFL